MNAVPTTARSAWVWVHVALAAAAMVATLPGRTHGLGLITEPLMRDLGVERVEYAAINLWATLLGAAFAVPFGWLADRIGVRVALTADLLALGGVVLLMSRLPAGRATELFALVLLTRGLGQSALSVGSLALLGKATGRASGAATGVYSALVAIGFMAAFGAVRYALQSRGADWREVWAGIGAGVLALVPVAMLFVNPRRLHGEAARADGDGLTLPQALATPAFWVFALATSLYGLVAAGVSLFNESILAERNFDRSVFLTVTVMSPLVGLASNLAAGALATPRRLGPLLAVGMGLLAAALLAFPLVRTLTHVYAYAVTMGVAGGIVTVVFFAVWGQVFGTAHLGKLQGAAQTLTVVASAVGPLVLAVGHERTGSYAPAFRVAAVVAVLFGLAAAWVPLPKR